MVSETAKNSICAACPHGIARHFPNALGDIVCLATGVNNTWGIPSLTHCDCYNYESLMTRTAEERRAAEEVRHREAARRAIEKFKGLWQGADGVIESEEARD